MKAVLTALARDARLNPLNLTRPDSHIKVANREMILRNLDVAATVDAEPVVLTSSEDADLLSALIGEGAASRPGLVPLESSEGTADGLFRLRGDLTEPFLLINAASCLCPDDITGLLRATPAVLVASAPTPSGMEVPVAGILDPSLFPMLESSRAASADSKDPAAVLSFWMRRPGVSTVRSARSMPVTYPWNVIEASVRVLAELKRPDMRGTVEQFVAIHGNVVIGEGTIVKSGSYIEGPVIIGDNCTIGPKAYIRPDTVIGNDCAIGNGFEIYDSVVFDGAVAKHYGYAGHSVIGAGVNLGCGFVSSDYRHDGKPHPTIIAGEKVDTGRRKLGAFLGDDVRTGINTSVYPGRKIWPGLFTLPGEVVQYDIIER